MSPDAEGFESVMWCLFSLACDMLMLIHTPPDLPIYPKNKVFSTEATFKKS